MPIPGVAAKNRRHAFSMPYQEKPNFQAKNGYFKKNEKKK